MNFYISLVISSQELDLNPARKLLGRPIVALAVLTAPSWVALFMIYGITTGSDPEGILLGAVVANALVAGFWRKRKFFYIAFFPVTVMSYLIRNAGPLSQAGAIVFASWVLLLGDVRSSAQTVYYLWNEDWKRYPSLKAISIPPRIWTPAVLIFAIVSLVVGARWLLGWEYGPDYGRDFLSTPPR